MHTYVHTVATYVRSIFACIIAYIHITLKIKCAYYAKWYIKRHTGVRVLTPIYIYIYIYTVYVCMYA